MQRMLTDLNIQQNDLCYFVVLIHFAIYIYKDASTVNSKVPGQ